MRNLKFFPYNTNHQIDISRICAEDDLPAFWFFDLNGVESWGTGSSIASAAVAAEKALKWEYSKLNGREPSPTYTPTSYANVAGYETVKDWAKAYKSDRKAWMKKVKVMTGWTQLA